jgi:hypothetical protein
VNKIDFQPSRNKYLKRDRAADQALEPRKLSCHLKEAELLLLILILSEYIFDKYNQEGKSKYIIHILIIIY